MSRNKLQPRDASGAVVMSQFETAAERVREMVQAGKTQAEQGALAANGFIQQVAGATGFAVGLYCHIAGIAKKEDAEDFVTGFMREAERQKKDKALGPLVNQSAESVEQFESKMNRIIRAVWGWGKGKNEVEGWGAEKVLNVLKGDGTVVEKLARLPTTRTDTPPKREDVIAEVQKRYTGTGDRVPSIPKLAESLAIPESVKSKGHTVTLTEADRGKLAVTKLSSQINLCPESHLAEIVEATINRLNQSPEATWREVGHAFHDVWVKLAEGTRVKPATRTLVKTEPAKAEAK